MIIPDQKKAASLILSRMKDGMPKSMPVKNEVTPTADDDPLMIAAQDVMQAFHDKSCADLMTSLKAFIQLCDDDSETEPSDDSEG